MTESTMLLSESHSDARYQNRGHLSADNIDRHSLAGQHHLRTFSNCQRNHEVTIRPIGQRLKAVVTCSSPSSCLILLPKQPSGAWPSETLDASLEFLFHHTLTTLPPPNKSLTTTIINHAYRHHFCSLLYATCSVKSSYVRHLHCLLRRLEHRY